VLKHEEIFKLWPGLASKSNVEKCKCIFVSYLKNNEYEYLAKSLTFVGLPEI